MLRDFIEAMRRHAPDPEASDDFADQWFLDVVVPEYRLTDARVSEAEGVDPDAMVLQLERDQAIARF